MKAIDMFKKIRGIFYYKKLPKNQLDDLLKENKFLIKVSKDLEYLSKNYNQYSFNFTKKVK